MSETDDNDFWLSTHGVGDAPLGPLDEELEGVRNLLNPELPTAREMEFCRRIIRGETQTEAYIAAFGYTGQEKSRQNWHQYASRLLKRPRVARQLHELRKKAEEYLNEDMANLISELNEDRELARALGQPGAAIQAVKTKASLLGLDNKPDNNTININLPESAADRILERVGHRLLDQNKPAIEADFEDVTNFKD